MLLIRPWIRMNKYRITAFHVVFFIFIVSNIGGCLTPIGDPPLFLGHLRGVPFWWTLQRCWLPWLVVVGLLLVVFYILDQGNFLRAPLEVRKMETEKESWKIEGLRNLIWLALILGAVFIQDPVGLREVLMIGAAAGSYFLTPKSIHEANDFNFHPVQEVAWLFAGIFATMVPAIDYITAHAEELGVGSPTKLYWLTGGLSALLDNAPTYLTLLAAAMGRHHMQLNDPGQVRFFAAQSELELLAISLAAVFFGAMTYIGNGPNFMVKAVCEHAKVRTPGFTSYLFNYALTILLPVMALVWVLFISRWRVI
jgi:Na+/H+ antiporter NhaD/arsenite permease-like protein